MAVLLRRRQLQSLLHRLPIQVMQVHKIKPGDKNAMYDISAGRPLQVVERCWYELVPLPHLHHGVPGTAGENSMTPY